VQHCLGCALRAQGDVAGGLAASARAIEIVKTYDFGWNGRGMALLLASDAARAAGTFRAPSLSWRRPPQPLRVDSARCPSPFSWINRGLAHLRAGESVDAIADCTAAIVRLPRLPHGYLARAVAHDLLGERGLAAVDARTFLVLSPKDPRRGKAEEIAARVPAGAARELAATWSAVASHLRCRPAPATRFRCGRRTSTIEFR